MVIIRTQYGVARILVAGLICAGNSKTQAQTDRAAGQTTRSISVSANSSQAGSLLPLSFPDLSGMEAPVQKQILEARSRVQASAGSIQTEQGQAYGRLGQIYQAYGLQDAAIACYTDAHILEPSAFKWPYYLGYLAQNNGDLQKAIVQYNTALQIRPGDEVATLRLAEANLKLNHLDEAGNLYQQVLSQNKQSVAALDGLGRLALARRQFAEAAEFLNKALTLNPDAAFLHYPLAMAYRGLGDVNRAQLELDKHGPAAPEVVDPYLTDIQQIKAGNTDLWQQGSQQMAAGDLAGAIETYRKLTESNPQDVVAKTYLGTALARAGRIADATSEFLQALQIAPENAEAHYCLAVVLASSGRDEEAIKHFQATIKKDPLFGEVHFQIANVLMRTRRYDEAAAEYAKALEKNPTEAFAYIMEALALVRLGRYADARSALEKGHSTSPTDMDITNALARLLAAAPDASIRDGRRAIQLIQPAMVQESVDTDQAETFAMALAEVGDFAKAANIQRSVIESANQDEPAARIAALHATLAGYERGEACRIPWQDDDPIFTPTPNKSGASPGAAADSPTRPHESSQLNPVVPFRWKSTDSQPTLLTGGRAAC